MINRRQQPPAKPPTPDDERWAAVLDQKRERYRQPVAHVPPSPPRVTLYSVPRRFDIATLLVVSLAYSLLFTLLRLLDAPTQVFVFIGMLTVVIGIAQAMFPYGNGPRRASMVAGAAYCGVLSLVGGFLSGGFGPGSCGVLGSLILGAPLGYLMGAIEAGVFLVADKVRRRWFPERPRGADTASDFDALDG